MDALSPALTIPGAAWLAMQQEVQSRLPEEACGVLIGRSGQVLEAVAVTNDLHSPTRYRMNAGEQLALFLRLEREGLDLLAIYHSHPNGPPVPSPTDAAEAYYPEAVYLIWSRSGDSWGCRGFFIRNGKIEEVPGGIIVRG